MHFKAAEPARQPTFATEKKPTGDGRWNSREKQAVHAAIKGEDGKKGAAGGRG